MELRNLVTKYVYRIEPKPGGGFIARATDPSITPLEASTREELTRKIQEAISAGLAQDFPGLKFPLQSNQARFSFHIERNPGGGFDIHSSDGSSPPIQAGSHDEIESHFAEKLLGFVAKNFAPEIAQALVAKGGSGDIKIFVGKPGFTLTKVDPNATSAFPESSAAQSSTGSTPTTNDGVLKDASFALGPTPISSSPITPGKDNSSAIMRFLLALLIIGTMIFFLFHRR